MTSVLLLHLADYQEEAVTTKGGSRPVTASCRLALAETWISHFFLRLFLDGWNNTDETVEVNNACH